MSVRRLADDSIQPASFAFSDDNAAWAEQKISQYPPGRQQSAVIPLLWRAQEQEGWISRAVIERVAEMLGMAYIRVLEVATFYTMFQLKPVGTRAHIQVCGTTPCMLRGSEALIEACQRKIDHDPHTTSPDGTMSWEEVECIGACVNGPVVMIGKDTYEDLTAERFEEIIDAFAAGRGDTIPAGTQIDRIFSAPVGGPTTLLHRTRETSARPRGAGAPAGPQEPTTAGRRRDVAEESAPAINGPSRSAKVSPSKAEAERAAFDERAGDGTPNQAMRPDATGAESPAGKADGGKATGKATRPPAGNGAGSAGTAPRSPKGTTTPTTELSPSADRGAETPLFTTAAGRDDLKLITGIGPALEGRLNALGVTTWRQVAELTPEQIAAVESRLRFRGRITRDNWLGQAKALADGGIDEYRRVFGKDPR